MLDDTNEESQVREISLSPNLRNDEEVLLSQRLTHLGYLTGVQLWSGITNIECRTQFFQVVN